MTETIVMSPSSTKRQPKLRADSEQQSVKGSGLNQAPGRYDESPENEGSKKPVGKSDWRNSGMAQPVPQRV